MNIVITNTKGGVGKTTTAVYLGMALSDRGTVAVYDADPQGSATEWALRAAEDGTPLPFPIRSVNLAGLRRISDTADFVIIDTAPGDPRLIDAALAVADVTVIPTQPSSIDMSRVWDTERVASQHGRTYVLITQSDRRSKAANVVKELLDAEGIGRFDTVIAMREAVRQSFGSRPGPDLNQYDQAADELLEALQ